MMLEHSAGRVEILPLIVRKTGKITRAALEEECD